MKTDQTTAERVRALIQAGLEHIGVVMAAHNEPALAGLEHVGVVMAAHNEPALVDALRALTSAQVLLDLELERKPPDRDALAEIMEHLHDQLGNEDMVVCTESGPLPYPEDLLDWKSIGLLENTEIAREGRVEHLLLGLMALCKFHPLSPDSWPAGNGYATRSSWGNIPPKAKCSACDELYKKELSK